MTKRLLLAIVCIVAVTVSAEAQKRERKLKRIDRGVQEKVFIPKGQWMAGGSVSYSEHEEDNLNFLVLKNVEGKGYNFKVSPYFGYFFADNLDLLMEYVGDVQKVIYLILGLIVLIVLAIYLKKKFHARMHSVMGEESSAASESTAAAKAQAAPKVAAAPLTHLSRLAHAQPGPDTAPEDKAPAGDTAPADTGERSSSSQS